MRRVVRRRTGWRESGSEGAVGTTKFPQILPPPGGRPEGGRRAGAAGPGSRHRFPRAGSHGRTAAGLGKAELRRMPGRKPTDARTPPAPNAPPVRPGVRYRGRRRGALSRSGRRVRSAGWAGPDDPGERSSRGPKVGRRRAVCGSRVVIRRGRETDPGTGGRRGREGRRGSHGISRRPSRPAGRARLRPWKVNGAAPKATRRSDRGAGRPGGGGAPRTPGTRCMVP